MTNARRDGLILVFIGCALFLWLGTAWERTSRVSMVDFKGVYYDGRCLLHQCDPYNEDQLLHFYRADGGDRPTDPAGLRRVVTLNVYLPTTSILIAPFAMLPWAPAHVLWMIVTAGLFVLACWLTWDLGAAYAPLFTGGLICLLLVGSELLLEIGNAAGVVVSLCVIAVWCFVRERFVWVGILAFALSLLVKPHDSGLVWLFFLLAGSTYRKRALQVLAVTAILGTAMVLWVASISPHWLPEMLANMRTITAHGNANDPSPDNVTPWLHGASIISLQTVFDVMINNPRFYSAATWLVCLPLLLAWGIKTWRSRPSLFDTWMALAGIAALSMLPVYHRQHDTRLVLLIVPASAMLWAKGGRLKWPALTIGAAAILLTDDLPLQLLGILANSMHATTASFKGQMLTIVFARPAPLILLLASVFYVWIYVRGLPLDRVTANSAETPSALASSSEKA
jgi:hypothetical protein